MSWRVLLLRYLENGQELYERFRLDEPWDSEHNKALIDQMPDVYKSAHAGLPAGQTVFVRPRFEGAIASGEEPMRFAQIADGLSATILLVEAAPSKAVVWTQPDDSEIDLDRVGELPGHPESPAFLAGIADGSVRMLPKTMEKELFRRLLQATDGEPVDWNEANGE